jgi:hypothetical protein
MDTSHISARRGISRFTGREDPEMGQADNANVAALRRDGSTFLGDVNNPATVPKVI